MAEKNIVLEAYESAVKAVGDVMQRAGAEFKKASHAAAPGIQVNLDKIAEIVGQPANAAEVTTPSCPNPTAGDCKSR